MLRSQGVSLTPLREEDLPLLESWINDRDTVVQSVPYRPVSPQEHREWFQGLAGRTDQVNFAIRVGDPPVLVGTCRLSAIHPIHRSAELAIRIGDAARRGHGTGTTAVRLLLSHAFEDLNLNRVFLHVFSSNPAALRSYEKAGFSHEGVLRQAAYVAGGYVDVVVLSVLREEFAPGGDHRESSGAPRAAV